MISRTAQEPKLAYHPEKQDGRGGARRHVSDFVTEYNERRLHSAIEYVTPLDKLLGRAVEIFVERDQKLDEARQRRAIRRQAARMAEPRTGEEARQEVQEGAKQLQTML